MHSKLSFEDQVLRIEEMIREYQPGDSVYRLELLKMIYSTFSGWVTRCARDFQHDWYEDEDCEEMIDSFWVWVVHKCDFSKFDLEKLEKRCFTAWIKAACKRRFHIYCDLKRRSVLGWRDCECFR